MTSLKTLGPLCEAVLMKLGVVFGKLFCWTERIIYVWNREKMEVQITSANKQRFSDSGWEADVMNVFTPSAYSDAVKSIFKCCTNVGPQYFFKIKWFIGWSLEYLRMYPCQGWISGWICKQHWKMHGTRDKSSFKAWVALNTRWWPSLLRTAARASIVTLRISVVTNTYMYLCESSYLLVTTALNAWSWWVYYKTLLQVVGGGSAPKSFTKQVWL